MNNYKIFKSTTARRSGRQFVQARVDDSRPLSIDEYSTAIDALEKAFLPAVTDIMENRLFLKRSVHGIGTVETLALYETAEGVLVEIVQDEFKGLMVESEDHAVIDKLYKMLLETPL